MLPCMSNAFSQSYETCEEKTTCGVLDNGNSVGYKITNSTLVCLSCIHVVARRDHWLHISDRGKIEQPWWTTIVKTERPCSTIETIKNDGISHYTVDTAKKL